MRVKGRVLYIIKGESTTVCFQVLGSAALLVNMYSICQVLTEKKNVWNGKEDASCSAALILIL